MESIQTSPFPSWRTCICASFLQLTSLIIISTSRVSATLPTWRQNSRWCHHAPLRRRSVCCSISVSVSVRPSFRPSVTLVQSVKTVAHIIRLCWLPCSHTVLVFIAKFCLDERQWGAAYQLSSGDMPSACDNWVSVWLACDICRRWCASAVCERSATSSHSFTLWSWRLTMPRHRSAALSQLQLQPLDQTNKLTRTWYSLVTHQNSSALIVN